jgi:UDP-glucuronate decarboxylase
MPAFSQVNPLDAYGSFPASPPHYQNNPVKTIKASTEGTLNMLGLAKRVCARILITSITDSR